MRSDRFLWYFAYASNLDPDTFIRRRGMHPLAACRGCVEGYRLVFDLPVGRGERAVGNIRVDPHASIWGIAYRLTRADAARLDRTEGVHRGYYRRVPVEVATEEGERLEAYSYDSPRGVSGRKPSPRYMGLILTGARHHGLPRRYIRYLENFELAREERKPA